MILVNNIICGRVGIATRNNRLPISVGSPFTSNNLNRGYLMGNLIDRTGRRYGMLTVVSRVGRAKDGHASWLCLCDCGNETIVSGGHLHSKMTRSCGCLNFTAHLIHGKQGQPIYHTWRNMKERCMNKNNTEYNNYGARGITVCNRWKNSFVNFYADMGEKPKDMTIERIDNDKGYSPNNCKWATHYEQSRNKRNNRIIKYQGKAQCLSDWAKELKVDRALLAYRLKQYPPQIAFNM